MDGVAAVLLLCLASVAMCMEKMVMERARMEDQESSATGYSYSSGSPKYISEAVKVEVPYAFGYVPQYEYQFLPIVDEKLHFVPKIHEDAQFRAYGNPGPSAMDVIEQNKIKYGYNKPWKAWNEGGSKQENENHKSEAAKGEKGHKQSLGWDKGSKGQNEKELQKGWYAVGGGNKKGHHDEGQYWAAQEEEGKSVKGGHFKKGQGHKKGQKTSGFHKVYNKDEYKKDHEFYDHADRKGYFNKYGNYDAKHSKDEGGFEKGGHEDYGLYADQKGKKAYYNKGHYEGEDKGHKAARGRDNFNKNYEEYVKRAGQRDANRYAYTDGNGVKWKF